MKNLLKSALVLSIPVFICSAIFNATILKTYVEAKSLNVKRAPAIELGQRHESIKDAVCYAHLVRQTENAARCK